MDDRDRELRETVDELADTLESLRTELQEPPQGPLGLPRPPTPGELLRLTERYTIPTLISLLETSIRTLELLAATIRVVDGRPLDDPGDGQSGTPAGADRIVSTSRRTLGALDEALADLQETAAGGEPENPDLQRLLSEARDLRAEVDARLADAMTESTTPTEPSPVNIEVKGGNEADEDPTPGTDPHEDDEHDDTDGGIDVDVDRELDSIKRELDESRTDTAGEFETEDALGVDDSEERIDVGRSSDDGDEDEPHTTGDERDDDADDLDDDAEPDSAEDPSDGEGTQN